MNRKTLVIAVLLTFALILTACKAATPEATSEPTEVPTAEESVPTETQEEAVETKPTETQEEKEEVVLRVGILSDLPCWNPYSCFSGIETNWLLYDRIADAGPEPGCDPVPGLANSWEHSEDYKTWTLHLDEGITFHDGNPFTAQSLVDHVKWVQSTSINYWYFETMMMESIEAVDELTVEYTTSEPISISPDFNYIWYYVVPPYIWEEFDDSSLWSHVYDPPIGTGPYMMTEHAKGEYIIWEAYDDYHRGKPPIDKMIWQIYSNEEAMINALLSGEIDSTYMDVSPQYVSVLSEDENITVEEKPGAINFNLYFNTVEDSSRHPAIADEAVREAIDYAIDKQQIVDVALLGHGITCPTNWACGPMFEGEVNPELEIVPYDLNKAKQILDDAGYTDSDSDGVRETPDGQPLEFRLFIHQEVSAELTMADSIKGWLSEIGIVLNTEALEDATWQNMVGERDYDLAIGTMKPDIDPGALDFYYSCWSADAGTSGNNAAGYCNPVVDDKVAEYVYSSDPEEALEAIFEAQRIMNEDRPFITLAAVNSVQAYRSDRFEFPSDTCHWTGIIGSQGLMNAVVKDE